MEKQTGETVQSLSDTGCNAETKKNIMEKEIGETVQSLSNTGCKAEWWPRGLRL